ncbi:MAG: DUF1800 domain-containing protein [Armatimonadetes bacterium]|nr:DUF1800 domain-containing protein [Armatimonadota bacterium]
MENSYGQQMGDRQKVAHLLRRFGFGASEAELDYYAKDGHTGAIDKLLDYEKIDDVVNVDPDSFSNGKNVVNMRVAQGIFAMRLVGTMRPLQEKMTLFWHNHFATSSQKVENAFAMLHHVDTLRANALGKFEVLLKAISKDPAMIYWLDNQENVAEHPNENFAREVMELFTLGVGHYTEKDVQEAARCFTGWSYGPPRRGPAFAARPTVNRGPNRFEVYKFVEGNHDDRSKTVLGQTGDFDGDDVLSLLCHQRQCATFITRKLWSWFGYENPEDALVERLSGRFYASGLDVRSLVRDVMEAPEFYSDKAVRRVIKNPIDFTVATIRQLGMGQTMLERMKEAIANPQINDKNGLNIALVRAMAPAQAALSASTSMGMELMTPPDVSGWRTGAYWITSATMVERMKWADKLFAGGPAGGAAGQNPLGGQRGAQVGALAYPLFARDPSAAGVVRVLMSVFDVTLPAAKVDGLVAAAEKAGAGSMNPRTANDVAREVCKLLFASPEFQMC